MNQEFKDIVLGFKRALNLIRTSEKKLLLAASFLMLITGILTNLPAVILGRLVDKIIGTSNFDFGIAFPFIGLIILIIWNTIYIICATFEQFTKTCHEDCKYHQ